MSSELFYPKQAVKFIGGRFNGFFGNIRWLGDTSACVIVVHENKPCEMIEDLIHLQDLAQWKIGKSFTELSLRPN